MAGMGRRTYLRDVNPYLICPLCRGYLVDATTVVECLHSFCRSCILKHLSAEAHCPTCNHVLNNAKPDIKADKALQDIVYKLVPGLYHKEMRRRREFYKKHPEHADSATPEQRGEDVSGRLIFAPEDAVSLSLEYLPPGADPLTIGASTNEAEPLHRSVNNNNNNNGNANRRYLQCPALVTIAHLKKFLALKYSVDLTRYTIEVCHRTAPLPEHWTLMDVAYMYAWKRNAPMRFFYRIAQEEPRLEAPLNDRPSTPGLGASLPPGDGSQLGRTSNDEKSDKDEKEIIVSKEPTNQVKSPIKILKNSDGRYEVLKSPVSRESPASTVVIPTLNEKLTTEEKGVNNPEFSVVSIGDRQNSNGVKITLKQCSPNSLSCKKPKVISNVLLRRCNTAENDSVDKSCGVVDERVKNNNEGSKKLDNNKDKNVVKDFSPVGVVVVDNIASDKQKRKVSFVEGQAPGVVKFNGELNSVIKKGAIDLPDKKKFLQSFQLTAKESNSESIIPLAKESFKNSTTKTTATNIANKKIDVYTFPSDPPLPAGAVKRKCPPGLPIFEAKRRKLPFQNQPKKLTVKPLNRVKNINHGQQATTSLLTTTTTTSTTTMATAITTITTTLATTPLSSSNSVLNSSSARPGTPILVNSGISNQPKSSPTIYSNTRNLLDGCGLNIPASLSITLTAPKSPNNISPGSLMGGGEAGNSKEGGGQQQQQQQQQPQQQHKSISNKVNPSITLNDRSVDPRVLKALKTGQIRMPAPSKVKREVKISPKRKKGDQGQLGEDALDLSGGSNKKIDIHPLRIPQPISKPNKNKQSSASSSSSSSSSVRDNNTAAQGQLVTLVGGQRYYRAPPGSLTPAAHRITDIPIPATSRTPVYAPSCMTSPTSSGRSNLSSVFPSLQSLFALSQAQNRQQLQIEARLRLPQSNTDGNSANSPSKSHLAAQCAPIKPARSSVTSLAVPIVKQPNNTSVPCEGGNLR